ncbi:MAG: hypothetical protein HUJ76_09370 [Parasporobacterium sp.]|nr:hypothetical protein [Parasporobacterium sp.]
MGNENGTWIMHGVAADDPQCIHTVDEAIEYINEAGFLPLFRNDIPGFSLEEQTIPEHWWSGDPEIDPWEWRAVIARRRAALYGKFFDGKAGFISREWIPYFSNFRRDGYDFDSLWDDEKATRRQKKIMDLFAEENSDDELFSYELRQKAGFGKEGEKGFESTVTNLQMLMYLCVRDFRQKKNRKGQGYGWSVAVYATPEHVFGYDHVRSAYNEPPVESGKRIALHIMELYPDASASQIRKVIGVQAGGTPEKKKPEKKADYPQNLFRAMKLNLKSPTEDQMMGLEFAIGQLQDDQREILRLHFEQGLTFREVGEITGISGARCGHLSRTALRHLKQPRKILWIKEGYQGRVLKMFSIAEEARKQFIKEGKAVQAEMMLKSPDALSGITAQHARLLMNAGIGNIGILRETMKEDFWNCRIPGIGDAIGRKLVAALYYSGLIDESFEAYKEEFDKNYYYAKRARMREEYQDGQS